MKRLAAALLALAASGCGGHRAAQSPHPHYELGAAYEAEGSWFYPRAQYAADETGLAMIAVAPDRALTADGEPFDDDALAAAHPTSQLPAIARLTNLETGRQVVVRINDRGPGRPDRLLAVTRRTAELLRFPASGVARIRLQVLPAESRAAVEALGGAPEERIAIAAAPREAVQAADLPAPGGRAAPARSVRVPANRAGEAAAPPPLRLPETVTEVAPSPGMLWIDLGTFGQFEFAHRRAARAAFAAPAIRRERRGHDERFRVQAGPFATVAAADAAFAQLRRSGITDARIVVE
ncbi:MAG: SPOR domain-containing protein [Acetobacteraceae bacterium]|nr:SPOR domain-containing protein [Acetobacteraceae bacterium]